MSILAKAAAKKILEYYGISHPNEIDVIAMAAGKNAFVDEQEMKGFEGRIIWTKNNSIITVNSNIKYKPKKRFVIAHELGHFELHKNARMFSCDKYSFLDWHSKGSQESEANIFAAELLMPETMFKEYSKGKMISLELISKLAETFETSITSTAFRYADIGNHPIAIVFCVDGIVKWKKINEEFTYQYIPNSMKVSKNSYAYDFFEGKVLPRTPDEIPLNAWFSSCYNYQPNKYIFEQCHPISEINAVLVILWER